MFVDACLTAQQQCPYLSTVSQGINCGFEPHLCPADNLRHCPRKTQQMRGVWFGAGSQHLGQLQVLLTREAAGSAAPAPETPGRWLCAPVWIWNFENQPRSLLVCSQQQCSERCCRILAKRHSHCGLSSKSKVLGPGWADNGTGKPCLTLLFDFE